MTENNLIPFEQVTTVIQDPLHFKFKLDIGEDAYQSLRLKKYVLDAIDASNGAIVGFGAAKSSLIASTFFAPSGFLGAIGVASASTPVGWAIAAGVVGAGLSLVVGKHLVRGSSSQVRSVPEFINTPMDVLAVGLFDLIGMLSVKFALVDGDMNGRERERIRNYFISEWGYDSAFVDAGLGEIERAANDHTIREVAEQLARFKKENPDCNYSTMAAEIMAFLNELSSVDGALDEREEMALEKVQSIFDEVNSVSVATVVTDTLDVVADAGKRTVENMSSAVTKVSEAAKQTIARKLDDRSKSKDED